MRRLLPTSQLLEAYKLLPESLRKQYTLVIVGGSGWLNEPIMEAIKQDQAAGYDIIKPQVYMPEEDLPMLQSGATILVHPALYEGFGISTLQAMACGTPVIAANNSSLPEVVGEAAILINAEDTKDISDKMETLLKDTGMQSKLVNRGLTQVQNYSWYASARILVDGALGNHGR